MLARLVNGLEPYLPPLSYEKNEMLNFWLRSTSDDQPSWSIDSKSICHPSPANKMKCFFLDYVHFWWLARMVDALKLHLPPFSSQKNEMLTFGICSLWMISQAGWWTQTPSITPLQPKNEMLIFWLCSTSDDQPGWSMDLNPIHHPSPAKTVKCSFLYYIQHVMLARLVNGLEPHPPPLPSQKMKCSFLGYIHLVIISRAVRWTQTPSATPLQPIKWNAHFCITFNFWWSAGLVNGLEPHQPPVSCQ